MLNVQNDTKKGIGKPEWLRRRLPSGPEYERLRSLLKDHRLTTVCREAQCPNQFECYAKGTATFMILRYLGFTAVASGPFVRSSYKAEKLYRQAAIKLKSDYQ